MSDILTASKNGVMRIIFNRPQKKNALTEEMYTELGRALDAATADDTVRAIVLSGEGGAFTAGNDLDDFARRPPTTLDAPVFQFLVKLAACEKPVIAAVEGVAIGIGTTLLFHCDLVYAAEHSKFAVPFTTLGLTPEGGSSLLFPLAMGHQHAAEKLWLGDPFGAHEAFDLGFVNRLLPAGETLKFALAQAERLAALPWGSVRGTKALLKGRAPPATGALPEGNTLLQRMRLEAAVFLERLSGPAAREAITAFKEKRKADFSGME